jgi:hypothetical protein
MLERYCGDRFAWLLDAAKGWYQQQKTIIKAWHAKHGDKDGNGSYDNGGKWQMVPEEYRLVRDIVGLLEDANSKDARADLVRLIPMPAAQQVFSTLYLIEAKERLDKKQSERYVPARDLPIDIHKIRATALSPDAMHCLSEQKHACNTKGVGVKRAADLQSRLDNDELVPAFIGTAMKGRTEIEKLNDIVAGAVPLTPEQRAAIDYIDGLASSALELGFIGVLGDGRQRLGLQPCFDIKQYKGAVYVFKDQAEALERVRKHLADAKLDGINLEALEKGARALASSRAIVYVANIGPGTGRVGLMAYQERAAGKDSIYWQPFSYKHGIVEAASAMTTKQEPSLFAELMKIQAQDRDELHKLAHNHARASARVIEEAHKIVDGVKAGKIKCDALLAIREDQRQQYFDGRWFDVHAESAATRDPIGEVIATFGKHKDHVGTLSYKYDTTKRFEAHGLDKDKLTALLENVATNNYKTGRQVYIRIDAARPGR